MNRHDCRVLAKVLSRDGTGVIVVCLVTVLSLVGCAPTQDMVSMQKDIMDVQRHVQDLDQRVKALERTVLGPGAKEGGHSLADLYARVDALRVEVGRLRGAIEETKHRQVVTKQPPTTNSVLNHGPSSKPTGGPVPVTPPPNPEKDAYSRALQLYRQGRYQAARKAFEAFVTQYPTSELADNAQFWVGECFYMQERYRDAVQAYQRVLDRYPDGNKVPYALLKEGAAFQKLGDVTAARILYERVIEKYPESPQARIARNWLKKLP